MIRTGRAAVDVDVAALPVLWLSDSVDFGSLPK